MRSVENLLEMGYVNVKNLLPNQLYENVLTPTELKRDMPVDRQRSVRVYSRERARVGGISVKVGNWYLLCGFSSGPFFHLDQKN